MLAWPRKSGVMTPNWAKMLLTRPKSGARIMAKVIPTATVLTRTGKNTTDRRNPRDRSGAVSITASSMPRTTFSPLVITA